MPDEIEQTHTVARNSSREPETLTNPGNGELESATVSNNANTLTPAGFPRIPGYIITGELARGGMGIVYRGYEESFDRQVAIKVMERGQNATRFVVESKVTAKLAHPGVPPVHALGTLADGRPYLVMKLVEGRTLAEELREPEPSRLFAALEQIAQTVGFAHSHGIVHRDLKPSNIMIGAFGEVLVMDWGLARILADRHVTQSDAEAGSASSFSTASTVTQAGQVKGTPAYMAPEQARGEDVDARADVFALGGMLATLLTGRPPFQAETPLETVLQAAQAELAECFRRLADCSADAELVAITKRCLSSNANDRFAHGRAVATALAAYRGGVEERLRQAERERIATVAQEQEHRKRRRTQFALGAAVCLLLVSATAFAWWQDHQAAAIRLETERTQSITQQAEADRRANESRLAGERDAERRYKAEQAREGVRASLQLATELRKEAKFQAAESAIAQATSFGKSGAPELLPEVERHRAELAFVVKLDTIRFDKWIWIEEETGRGHYNTLTTHADYTLAFAEFSLDLRSLEPQDAAKQIREMPIRSEILAALDDWALHEPRDDVRQRALATARLVEPDAWLDQLRDSQQWKVTATLKRLTEQANFEKLHPARVCVLVQLLTRAKLDAVPLIIAARVKFPANFDLALMLGLSQDRVAKDGRQIGAYEAARALRPDVYAVWMNLGSRLSEMGDTETAIAMFRTAIQLKPKYAQAHNSLGLAYAARGNPEDAIAAFQKAIELNPNFVPAYINYGLELRKRNDFPRAIAAYQKAIELSPKNSVAHNNLGIVLKQTNDLKGAITAYKKAIQLNPKSAFAHNNLGIAYQANGQTDLALASFQKAIEIDPKYANPHFQMGRILAERKDHAGAIAAYRKSIELNPNSATTYNNLGLELRVTKDIPGAIVAFKKAAELDLKLPQPSLNLGDSALKQKDYAEAVKYARDAIQRDPKYASAYALLGDALLNQGDVPGARAAFEQAAKFDKKWESKLANLPPRDVAPPPRERKP